MALVKIHVTGVVQGVGFRPFIYQIATRANLKGWVANTSAGVDIEVEGSSAALDAFLRTLTDEKPALARIDSIQIKLASVTCTQDVLQIIAVLNGAIQMRADRRECPELTCRRAN